jgi:hypothetical protein
VYRSVDGGDTWGPFGTGLTMPDVLSLAIASDGSMLHAGTDGGAAFEVALGA